MKKSQLIAFTAIVMGMMFLTAFNAFAAAPFTGNEWTGNSTVFSVNSENARTHHYTYNTLKGALDGYTMYPESDNNAYYMTLRDLRATDAGAWKFLYSINPSMRPWPSSSPQIGRESRFLEADFDDSGWDNMAVPSNWHINWLPGTNIKKYDKITYKENGYGWANSETIGGVLYSNTMSNGVTNQEAPQSYNGVGTYRRHFTVPLSWSDRKVTLNFDGVDGFYVWVNGVPIGYSEDTMAHKEFDVTDAVNFGGDNVIAVQVIRWVSGSFLEDQDMIRVSGIFRDIYLLARRTVDLYDFEIATVPTVEGSFDGNWNLSITGFLRDWGKTATAGRDGTTVYARLYDVDGNPASDEISSNIGAFGTVVTNPNTTDYTGWQIGMGYRNLSVEGARRTLNFTGLNVKPWSAEHPNLYKLVLRVGDQYTCIRVGFRYYSFTHDTNNPRVFINGQRLLLHGTNAHEMSPYNGRALTEEEIRKDLRMMKEGNFNHVRMSHYIHNTKYYDICDEYGIYVMDEANLETHQRRNLTVSTNSHIWGQAIRDRQVNMYERDKNYACVFSWSLGNESGGGSGANPYHRNWLKARDTLRTIHSEFERTSVPSGESNSQTSDLLSYMYSTAQTWNGYTGNRPTYLCEFSHGEGNSNGNYREYINVFESQLRTIGGAIWDWVDQSIWTPLPGERAANWPEQGFMAVGGDWGDTSNDDFFIGDGVLFADRTPKESWGEIRYYNQMIRANYTSNTNTSVTYRLRNKNLFANVSEFDMDWEVTENGIVVLRGAGIHSCGPCPSSITAVKYTTEDITTVFGNIPNPKQGAEYLFNLSYKLREDTLWAKKGFEIAHEQFALNILSTPRARVLPVSGDTMTVTGTGGNVSVTGPNFSIDFTNGVITSYKYKNVEIISNGPVPNFFRGVLDNEMAGSGSAGNNFRTWYNPAFVTGTVSVQRTIAGNLVVITVPNTWSAKNLTTTTTYTIYPDGEVKVNERYVFSSQPGANNDVGEIGTIMKLNPGFENLTWYGRGPNDAYVDRRLGVPVGIFSNTVADNFVPYQRSQEMGTKNDTRWFALTNDAGLGLVFKSGKFPAGNAFSGSHTAAGTSAYNASDLVEFNALHYAPIELSPSQNHTRHAYEVLDIRPNSAVSETFLRVSMCSTGVGGDNTWGARPLAQYRININGARTYEYNFSMQPTDNYSITAANEFWTSSRNFYENLRNLLPVAVAVGVPTTSAEYQAAAGIAASSGDIDTLNAYNALRSLADSVVFTKGLIVNLIDTLKDESSFTADLLLQNRAAADMKIAVYLAIYNDGNKLVAVTQSEAKDLNVNGDLSLSLRVSGLTFGPGYSAKVFIWNEDYIPLISGSINLSLD